MLGVVLLSPQNEIIHSFGNDKFKKHFFGDDECIFKEKQSEEHQSSSSGISSPTLYSSFSSSSNSSIFSENKQKNNSESEIENENCKMFIQKELLFNNNNGNKGEEHLLYQLLPLIAICRSNNNQQLLLFKNIKLSSSKDHLQIYIKYLTFSYILIMIYNNKSLLELPEELLFSSLINCFNFHYGYQQFPLLSLNTPFVKQLKKRCEFRINLLLNNNKENNNIFNKNYSLLNDKFINKEINFILIPQLKELTKNISQKFGCNNIEDINCLIICSNRLIASSSSSLNNKELGSILNFIRQPLNKNENNILLKYQSEHFFISNNKQKKQFLYNIFNISLNEKIELILLTPSDNLLIIYNITECLQIFENIIDNNYLNNNLLLLLLNNNKYIENIKINLNNFIISNKLPKGYFYYLRNPKLTIKYIQRLWNHFKILLERFILLNNKNSSNSSFSSSSSTISEISTSHSQNNFYSEIEEEQIIISQNLNLLNVNLNKIKKLLIFLLNELFTWNSLQNKNKLLPTFRHLINNNNKLIQIINSFDNKIEKINKNELKIAPTNFGLEMIGYNFKQIYGGLPFFFHFVEEKYSQLFSQLIDEFSITLSEEENLNNNINFIEEEEETMTVIKTLDKLLVLQFKIQCNNNKNNKKENFKQKVTKTTFKFLFGDLEEKKNIFKFNCLFLFPSQINIILAVKQTQILINILQQQINN